MSLLNKIEISILNSYYGDLLTPHQREMIRLNNDCDISLMEISEQFNISRQAVRDAIVRGEKTLNDYESKLQLIAKDRALMVELRALADLCDNNSQAIKVKLLDLIANLEE